MPTRRLTQQPRPDQDSGRAGSRRAKQKRRDCERVARILETKIEYISSPAFTSPDAAELILAPFPESDDEAAMVAGSATGSPLAPAYLAALYAVPLLTAAHEYHLFRKMNYLKFRAAQVREDVHPDRPQIGLVDQIAALLADAVATRNAIVQANLRLVVSIAKTFVDPASPFDELVSEGHPPLIRAAEIFDFERGLRFSTYATWAIRNSLMRSVQRNRRRALRFSLPGGDFLDGAIESRPAPVASERRSREVESDVARALGILEPRQRQIVAARFGLDASRRARKLREIAESVQLSTERVRQLLSQSLDQLRDDGKLDSAVDLVD